MSSAFVEANMPDLNHFPLHSSDKIRYADTDRQGHVNNAVFASFLETGRTELLYNDENEIIQKDCSFVIASLNLNFIRELHWPGEVIIKTGIKKIGNSSLKLEQYLVQENIIAAKAETTIVQVSNSHKKSHPFTQEVRKRLEHYLIN